VQRCRVAETECPVMPGVDAIQTVWAFTTTVIG
jgi:hypothetical protein